MTNKPKVIKLAQPGFDVQTAGDENLIYNSNWPLLKIYKSGSFIIPDTSTPFSSQAVTTIDTHDLGFPPMFWPFANTTIDLWTGASTVVVPERRSEFNGDLVSGLVSASSKDIHYYGSLNFSGPGRIYYYIFNLDLTKNFKAPTIRTGGVTSAVPTKVFKIAKKGKDIHSKNMDDYIIHSSARTPLVHSVTNQQTVFNPLTSTYDVTVYHGLGYIPMAFVYTRPTSGFGTDSFSLMQTGTGGGGIGVFVDKQNVRFTMSASGTEVSIVVLKDPFIVNNQVNVTI